MLCTKEIKKGKKLLPGVSCGIKMFAIRCPSPTKRNKFFAFNNPILRSDIFEKCWRPGS